MKKIANDLTELIGNTPLLKLSRYGKDYPVTLLAKLEYLNPLGSVKDRISYAMIDDAEKKGLINKNTVIIESTSGNTGIALAFVSAIKGYRLIITLPDTFSIERQKLMIALGAELIMTPGSEGVDGAVRKAKELALRIPNSYIPQQFENQSNPDIHFRTTANEIWNDTEGEVDIFVAGVGTGGTITGVGNALKLKKPNIKIITIEPFDSPILSTGKPSPHKLQGLSPNFIPKIFDENVVDEIIQVKTDEAYETSRKLARTEGLIVGISSGATMYASTIVASRPENKGKTIVTLFADSGERYLSTPLYE